MQDRQLYEQILGIASPWFVERVELKLEEGEVHVNLAHRDGPWPCPECGRECSLYDHAAERTWRHLDTCQYQTLLHAAVPRTECPAHGVRTVAVRLALSWDEVDGIMRRAVQRGLARREAEEIACLGVDEKSFKKGHRYATIVTDLMRGRVLYVAEDRQQSSLDGFWQTLSAEQREAIDGVAIDMWDPYENSIRAHLPQAAEKIVYDKFHVAKHLGEAVDKVRRQENKQLRAAGDDRLVGSRYQWLKHPKNFRDDQRRDFAALRNSNLKTARAWALKEQAMELWEYRYEGPARKHFAWWYRWATHSRLGPMLEKAKLLKRRLPNILTYLRHGITNAVSESLNSKIQWIKYTARGFRNFENFKTAIYFHCGALDLAPQPT